MSNRSSFIKRVGMMTMRITHAEDAAPSFTVPQTACATPHQPPLVIQSKFAAYANGQFVPVARLGEPVVVVKRTPTFKAATLPQEDDHAYNQLQRIVALARRVA